MSCFTKDQYPALPQGTVGLKIHKWCCGDDCCCNAMQIWAMLPTTHPWTPAWRKEEKQWGYRLWEGDWFWIDGYSDQEDAKEELQAACDHYGFKVDLSGDYWDWEDNECEVKDGKVVQGEAKKPEEET